MFTGAQFPSHFIPDMLTGLDEPVRRYFSHAIREGAPLGGVRLVMHGRIKAGIWLPFTAVEQCDGRSFVWRARVGWKAFAPLAVTDRFADGIGGTQIRLGNRVTLAQARDEDTARSAAGRAALESVVFAPTRVLPVQGVSWHAEQPEVIVADFALFPERPQVRVRLDEHGAVREVWAQRWGPLARRRFGYLPCGGVIHAERCFGDLVVPSKITVGWWFGTDRFTPFFRAEIDHLLPLP
ncbi:MAG TPA: DUF6544 family protein [Pseudonocardiaceae bacterium]|nr:DUF6544 family protein [Pseudonocardiaceae bacterium]